MQLRSIRVKNFRSIVQASTMKLSQSTILIGPNNEGKSNVLRALVLSMNILLGRRPSGRLRAMRYVDSRSYDWERDFPVNLQDQEPEGNSEFLLDFSLLPQDESDFYSTVGSRIREHLPIRVVVGRDRRPKITVAKPGQANKKLRDKSSEIGEFIRKRFELEYIPAIRTASSAQRVVDDLLSRELRELEDTKEYKDALAAIANLQRPILQELSRSIAETLKQFLPALNSVNIQIAEERRYAALRNAEVYVDDGTNTDLRFKGDGVQSLAALALMRHASKRKREGKGVLVAIEEPESHLHPGAIRELHDVIMQLANNQQVVLTTHCPLFVDRQNIGSNVIVKGGKATPAKKIDEVREILGVHASDNLQHAEHVLVVEGEDDRVALEALLSNASAQIGRALRRHRIAIDVLGGASNLLYKLGLIRDAMCSAYCFLDNDKAGKEAVAKAKTGRLLSDADYALTVCGGMSESEFEDLLSVGIHKRVAKDRFSVMSIAVPSNQRKNKWSSRMKFAFEAAGKTWDKHVEMSLKAAVAEEVARSPANALAAGRRGVFDNLVAVLESRLAKKAN